MKFSVDKNLTFEQAVELMFEKLGDCKIMALASAVNDQVMVRNVSCLFYDGKVWFKTDKNFRKTQQLFQNPQVALCWSGVQIEGVARNCGLVVDEPDRRFEKLYKEHLWGSYNKYSHEDTEILKAVYGGSWSWRRRPILILYNGHVYAASMNGMPHGTATIGGNNFDGHFCIHFKNSKTHETNRVDSEHQNAVNRASRATW